MVLEITDQNFKETVQENSILLVEFWAPWCSYCKLLEPVLEELSEEYAGQLTIGKINVETDAEVSTELQVLSLPTMLFYKNGNLLGRVNGYVPKDKLEEVIDQVLKQ